MLADWPEAARTVALASPAINVVGQVAALADAMRETSGGDVVHGFDGRLTEDAREHVA